MRTLRRFIVRLIGFLPGQRDEARLREEIEGHLALQTAENMRAGMAPDEARRQAILKFGAVEAIKENYREERSLPLLGHLLQDSRYAVRMLRRNPGFTCVAVLTLALGIGTNTAMFSVVNAVMLRPLPYPNAEQLVWISESNPDLSRPTASVSYPNFLDWRAQARAFVAIAAIQSDSFTTASTEETEIVRGANVTEQFLTVLGIPPVRGRDFHSQETQSGDTRVAIISDGFWKRRFGARSDILGLRIRLDADQYTIIGLLPPRFEWGDIEVLTPLVADPGGNRGNHLLAVIGRLQGGVTIQQAQDELTRIAAALADQFPATNAGWTVRMTSLYDWLIPATVRHSLLVLLGAVGVVLLIACANVANLLLARALVRQKEFSIRVAVGAARGRIIRQLLTESIVLSLLAALVGVAGAAVVARLLISYGPESLPRLDQLSVDLSVVLFACVAATGTVFLFGSIPAIHVARRPPAVALQTAARGSSGGKGPQRLRAILTVVEVALSVALLIGAGLLLRSFWNLQRVNPGFNSSSVMVARVATAPGSNRRTFYDRLLSEILELPGMKAAATASGIPLAGGNTVTEVVDPMSAQETSANWRVVSPGYFATMGIPLRGRDYSWNEAPRTTIIISEAMARTYWPHQDPIGKTITVRSLGNRARLVIGVAGDVRHIALDSEERSIVYYPIVDTVFGEMRIAWRSAGDSASHLAAIREIVRRADPTAALHDAQTLDAVVSEYFGPRRFNTYLLGSFATAALILAAIGLFGIMAFIVSQRTHEIGLRVALGADRRSIFRLILGHGAVLTLIGAAIGLTCAFWLTRVIGRLLYGISAKDPMTFVVVPLLLVVVSIVACYIPARRAARVDPLVALRYE